MLNTLMSNLNTIVLFIDQATENLHVSMFMITDVLYD